MNDLYLIANSTVLKNLLGITNEKELDLAEAELSRANMMLLYENGFIDFSSGGFCFIHKFLFGDVYEWAGQIDLFSTAWLNDTLPQMVQLAKQAKIMSDKYAVVCTNPPYMNKLEGQLKKFVVDNYKAYSGDLFSVFIYRNFDYCKINGYSAFMTPIVWLFIKTYETSWDFKRNPLI